MNLPKLSASMLRAATAPQSFERGREYYQRGAISIASILDSVLLGDCEGAQRHTTACGSNWTRPVIETVADAVIPHRPVWVARMSIKQAHAQLGQTHEWQAYLGKLKELYKRRPALQAQLRRI